MAFETLRKQVTHKRDKVWKERDNVDLYTGESKEKLESDKKKKNRIEVDHVLEIQLMDRAGKLAWDNAPVAARTREAHKQFSEV